MNVDGDKTYLYATDLSTHIACPHATFLNLQAAQGKIDRVVYNNPQLEALRKKGEDFEKSHIEALKASYKNVVTIEKSDTAFAETVMVMTLGADIIYQGRLESGQWRGYADFLIRVEKPCKAFGDWSYEVMDTKLSKETRAGAILQISLYSEILEEIQGLRPEFMHIKNPAGEIQYRTNDFAAYYRMMKAKLLHAINATEEPNYPDPVPHCEICNWWQSCNDRRRNDDHLSFIAGMGNRQMREVKDWKVSTLEAMANLHPTLAYSPARGSKKTYEKLAYQANLQRATRNVNKVIVETLPLDPDFGFFRLPEPTDQDIFFDFEGDPFVGTSGLEYLFGWEDKKGYHELWAYNEQEEKHALETFMDLMMQLWEFNRAFHIYHFGAYEQSALKRLVGKYATREDELDTLLRAGVFVNLHTIFRHAVIAGVESYSLKALEQIHGYVREADLRDVGKHKQLYEGLLESGSIDDIPEDSKKIVRDYNRDDCISTRYLRDWLETERSNLINQGNNIPRPIPGEPEASEDIRDHLKEIQPLFDALTEGIPFEAENRSEEQQAKWLLANMLDWYRREKKSFWWEVFRLRELTDEELLEEKDPLAGLKYINKRVPVKQSQADYYSFPEQETTLKVGNEVRFKETSIGTIHSLDLDTRIVSIKKVGEHLDLHPTHLICEDNIRDTTKIKAIIRVAKWVVQHGMDANGQYRAGRDLLLRIKPRSSGSFIATGDAQKDAVARVKLLNNGVLPVQGPPGTGKSHTASNMIIDLIKAGKKIGIAAMSHKVITSLLKKVLKCSVEEGITIRMIQKIGNDEELSDPGWKETKDNKVVSKCIKEGFNIVAGTAFLWARPELFESVDYLFVDEAGQLSLIDTIALSHAGKNLVLLGDPQQLKQPLKGQHPEGTQVSALEHILQNEKTITSDRGVFLDKTWRMHPAINELVSELFYAGKLESEPSTAHQHIKGTTPYNRPGIYYHPVEHSGNQNGSPEEVKVIEGIVNNLLRSNAAWITSEGKQEQFTKEHIRIISPYNVQVSALRKTLPGFEIGTVDKFQGQEAAVVIFSMATSTPEEAPRGMEFLYSLNRLNVAISRARVVFILVANPSLLVPVCKSPSQMKLANALCRLKEVAIV